MVVISLTNQSFRNIFLDLSLLDLFSTFHRLENQFYAHSQTPQNFTHRVALFLYQLGLFIGFFSAHRVCSKNL